MISARWGQETNPFPPNLSCNDLLVALESGTLNINTLSAMLTQPRPASASPDSGLTPSTTPAQQMMPTSFPADSAAALPQSPGNTASPDGLSPNGGSPAAAAGAPVQVPVTGAPSSCGLAVGQLLTLLMGDLDGAGTSAPVGVLEAPTVAGVRFCALCGFKYFHVPMT